MERESNKLVYTLNQMALKFKLLSHVGLIRIAAILVVVRQTLDDCLAQTIVKILLWFRANQLLIVAALILKQPNLLVLFSLIGEEFMQL